MWELMDKSASKVYLELAGILESTYIMLNV